MIGKNISHYKILEKLGEGGMGVVYKAEDTKLKRTVALKFLPPDLTRDPDAKKRFSQEAQAASALQHHNICTIHEIDQTEDGQMFICMDYYEGETLKEKLESGLLNVEDTINYTIQIARGLGKAHSQGINHRDIKPANIIVTPDDEIKILDFGLSKIKGQTKLTKSGSTMGTVGYMSPEQVQGEEVDQRTDIWSVGVVLYEMITGKLLFEGEYDQAVMYSIVHKKPQDFTTRQSDIPEELKQIIFKSLEKDREKRYQSAEELLKNLEKLQSERIDAKTKVFDFKVLAQNLKKPRNAIFSLIIISVIFVVVFLLYQHYKNVENARALLPQIEKLANEQKYIKAYDLAVQSEKYFKEDTTLIRLMPIISDKLTIISRLGGASVYLKRFMPDVHGKFPDKVYVGVTPIQDLTVPRTDHVVYLEKEGYVSVERLASSQLNREQGRINGFIGNKIKFEVQLLQSDNITENMVFVPGGEYNLVGWGMPTSVKVLLDDYTVDKYEVSNKQYKHFITEGGYLKKQFWKYPFRDNGKELSWKESMLYFKDRTGLPGPRSWVNQEFPDGEGDYPVTDITWYEAAAYAGFIGKSLPTIFQWEKAARDGKWFYRGIFMPWGLQYTLKGSQYRANLEGTGPVSVDRNEFGISPYGCYNMAGNAKEWCLNEVSGGYATTGGSWEDPYYIFAYYGVYSGFYASISLGFRCVRNSESPTGDQGAMKVNPEKLIPSYSPANESTFRSFLSFYKYDKKPLNAQVIETEESVDWIKEKVNFSGVNDDHITAYLYLPKRVKKPFQCLNLIPHDGVFFWRMDATEVVKNFLAPQIKSGRAVLAVVPKGAREREREAGYVRPERNSVKYRDQTVDFATEFSIGVDYLATRSDIDMDKLAYFAISAGEFKLIFPVVENRYRSVIFFASGLEPENKEAFPEVNAINFIPYIKAPTLLLNGKQDEVYPEKTHAYPLYDLLPEQKKIALVDGGHLPSIEKTVPIINEWLDKTLGPVNFK